MAEKYLTANNARSIARAAASLMNIDLDELRRYCAETKESNDPIPRINRALLPMAEQIQRDFSALDFAAQSKN